MATVQVVNLSNESVGSLELHDDVFAVKVNEPLVHQVIKAQLAGKRQGTAKTKTKGEVRGGGRKPYKQKGTGNSRQGSIRSPLKAGGGQVFGPVPRSYAQATPKAMMQGALRSVLSDRLNAKRLLVVDEFALSSHKTKHLVDILSNNFKIDQILMIDEDNTTLAMASSNIPRVKFLRTEGLNVYDVVRNEWLLISKRSIELIQQRLLA